MAINYFGEARMKQLLALIKGQLDLKATPADIAKAITDANLAQYALDADLDAAVLRIAENETDIAAIQEALKSVATTEGLEQLTNDVNTIKGDYLKAADKTELSDAIAAEKERAEGIESGLDTRVKAIEDDYLKAADKYDDTALAARVKAVEDDYLKASDKEELQTAITNAVKAHDESDAAHAALFTALNNKDTAMQGEIDALETEVAKKANSADIVDYTVTVAESSPEGYAKAYTFSQKGAEIATINIPKDMVVESGSVVVDPEGQPAGTYIKLVLANATEDELFINVGDLIEYVTSGSAEGDQIVVAVSADHKVTATLSAGSVTLAQLHADVQAEIAKAHEHSNKAELDKVVDGDVAKWNAAEQNAKDYADGLNTAMDTRMQAVEGAKHTHDNKAVLDGITAEMVAAWNEADVEYTEAEVTAMWNEVFGA